MNSLDNLKPISNYGSIRKKYFLMKWLLIKMILGIILFQLGIHNKLHHFYQQNFLKPPLNVHQHKNLYSKCSVWIPSNNSSYNTSSMIWFRLPMNGGITHLKHRRSPQEVHHASLHVQKVQCLSSKYHICALNIRKVAKIQRQEPNQPR